MNIEELREFVLSKPGVSEGFPFDNDTLVFKVLGKMFLLVSLNSQPLRFNFKALPADGLRLREHYAAVTPGYHMDKKHWNTAMIDGSIPESEIMQWIDTSYQLIIEKLPKYKQEELKNEA